MRCNPWRWLWGLLLIAPLSWIVLHLHHTAIENDLRARATEALERAGLSWAATSFSGRDASLTGLAPEEAEPSQAADLVRSVWGVRVVDARTDLIKSVETLVWSAKLEPAGVVRLSGFVPGEPARKALLQAVRSTLPNARIEDGMKLARGGPPRDVFINGAGFGLKQLAALQEGSVELSGTALSIAGLAADRGSLKTVRSRLKSLPSGITLAREAISGPHIETYVWGAVASASQLALSGYAPTEEIRDQLFRSAKTLFSDRAIVDRVEVAEGAPGGFAVAVQAGLDQLHRLRSGEFAFSGTAAMLKGEAVDKATADSVRSAFISAVKPPLTAETKITAPEPPPPPSPPAVAPAPEPPPPPPVAAPAPIAAPPPYSTIARIEGGQIELTGNVPSEDERIALVTATRGRFPDLSVKDNLDVKAGAPDGWRACLLAGLSGLGRLTTGDLTMSGLNLTAKGITNDDDVAKALAAEVKGAAGQGCETSVDVTSTGEKQAEKRRRAEEEARLIAQAKAKELEQQRLAAEIEARRKAEQDEQTKAASAAQAAAANAANDARLVAARAEAAKCEKLLSAAMAVGVINFKRADAALEPASKPTLDALAKIANQCPGFKISIEGHTDAEGIPERNNPLSERRAKAVSDYLISVGVEPARLKAVGYGAERPIADNATPEGRSKNRRIEFKVMAE